MKKRLSCFILIICLAFTLCSCKKAEEKTSPVKGWTPVSSMQPELAEQFSVDYYQDGYKLISLADGSRFLVVPEGFDIPAGTADDVAVIKQPVNNIYLAATAAMCLFDALDALPVIAFSGTRESGWYIDNAVKAMQDGSMVYAGKYSEPDYELLLSKGCPLAVESMMIGHASDVKAKLEELGIAVLVDQSSNESHPLARSEWIKLYAALLNKEELAGEIFEKQMEYLRSVESLKSTGKTVAFFYISSSGNAVVRKSGDYVSRMIELAGGKYIFDDIGDSSAATATVNMEMESFFSAAKDADYIIYNSTIGGEVSDMDELLAKSSLLKEFKAVKNGDVWCTNKNMYQETTGLGEMIKSFRMIFTGEADDVTELPYLYRLSASE